MATTTVTSVLTSIVTAASSVSPTSTNRATPQGGVIEGILPNVYSATDPIKTFIIQVCHFSLCVMNLRAKRDLICVRPCVFRQLASANVVVVQ